MFSCLSSARNDVRRVRELHFIFKTRLLNVLAGKAPAPPSRVRVDLGKSEDLPKWQAMTQVTYMGLFNNKLSGTLPTTLLFLQELLFITFKTN
jgi:hypothetical protein